MRWMAVAVTMLLPLSSAAQATETQPAPVLTQALLEQLENLKFSGYVQARYVHIQEKPTNGFTVRRSRLKAIFKNDWSRYMLQIDASPSGVELRDAEATLIEPWTGKDLEFTVGQMKWPFGYEVFVSSAERELPERSRVVRAFAPNDRDRGAKFMVRHGPFQLVTGVFNGNGIDAERDNDSSKDVVGRLGVDLKWISGGVSGWWGESLQPFTGSEGGYAPRNRLGLDLQLTLEALPLGKTQLRGEFIAGRTYFRGGEEQFGVPALGWYAVLSQHLPLNTQLAVRYDYFDGAAGTPDSATAGKPAVTNGIGTLGVAVAHHFNKHLKLTGAYELPMTNLVPGATDPADNVLTFQLQAKF